MATDDLDELISSLTRLPVAAMLTDLRTHTFIALNDRAAEVFGAPAAELVGRDVLPYIDARDRDAARAAYAAMADKVIDGYQVRRRLASAAGEERTVSVWGRRVELPPKQYGLWVLIPGAEGLNAIELLMMGASSVVLAVTDHDWQIEYMTADAELLGGRGSDLRGFPLLGLVHPSAAAEFSAAAARTTTDHVAVTVLTRMRAAHEQWVDRYCVIVRLCEHEPPRLGIVISEGPAASAAPAADQLDEHLRQSVLEARGAQTLDALPALTGLPHGNELSARQAEIVSRLVAGQQAADIARSMFLSPSTVRNHLSAIYRKFGVHSQAQLLATLLRALAQNHPTG